MRRFVTIHPVGHEPADSLVLAGVIKAVWAVHEVPLVLDPQVDGSIVVGEQLATEPEVEDDGQADDPEPEPEVEPVRPAAKSKPIPAKPAAQRTKLSDDDIVAAVRQNAPIGTSDLAKLMGAGSVGGFTRQLRRMAGQGLIEQRGATWVIPGAASAAASNGTTAAAAPAKPGSGVVTGPVERRPFDPEAARFRAAGEL